MLKIRNLKKKYKDFSLDCSLELKKGYITGLIGRNGAGKSTLFKLLLGLKKKDGGSIELFGKNVENLLEEDMQKIAVVFNNSGFDEDFTIEQVILMLKILFKKFDEIKFRKDIEKFKLPFNKKIAEFSTGMKSKLKLIIALSYEAKILILDEPTSGLDVIARDELLEMIREYVEQNEEVSVIISSHISSDLESICDDFYMIDNGTVILNEETDVLLSNYGILKVTSKDYDKIDKKYILKTKKENLGIKMLTNEKQYYLENFKDIVIENSGIDEFFTMMIKGE